MICAEGEGWNWEPTTPHVAGGSLEGKPNLLEVTRAGCTCLGPISCRLASPALLQGKILKPQQGKEGFRANKQKHQEFPAWPLQMEPSLPPLPSECKLTTCLLSCPTLELPNPHKHTGTGRESHSKICGQSAQVPPMDTEHSLKTVNVTPAVMLALENLS